MSDERLDHLLVPSYHQHIIMVGLRKVEDRPTPPCVYNHRVYLCSVIAAFAAIMIGYDSAFIGGTIALPSFKNEFGLTTKTAAQYNLISANIVSTFQAGWYALHRLNLVLNILKRNSFAVSLARFSGTRHVIVFQCASGAFTYSHLCYFDQVTFWVISGDS